MVEVEEKGCERGVFSFCSLLVQFALCASCLSRSPLALCVPPFQSHRKSSTHSRPEPKEKTSKRPLLDPTRRKQNESAIQVLEGARRLLSPSLSPSLSSSLLLPRQLREHQLLRELVRGVLVLDDVLRVVGDELVEVLGRGFDRRGRRLRGGRGQGRRLGADGGGHCVIADACARSTSRAKRRRRSRRARAKPALCALFLQGRKRKK